MERQVQPWFCYMVQCRDGSFYVGMTNDLGERVKEHNWGTKSLFTARRRPVKLIWWEQFATQSEARRREVELKGWSREKKKLRMLEVNPSASAARPPQGKGE